MRLTFTIDTNIDQEGFVKDRPPEETVAKNVATLIEEFNRLLDDEYGVLNHETIIRVLSAKWHPEQDTPALLTEEHADRIGKANARVQNDSLAGDADKLEYVNPYAPLKADQDVFVRLDTDVETQVFHNKNHWAHRTRKRLNVADAHHNEGLRPCGQCWPGLGEWPTT